MRKVILTTAAVISLIAGGVLYADRAQAAPLFNGLEGALPASNIENVQLLVRYYRGHRYCWAESSLKCTTSFRSMAS